MNPEQTQLIQSTWRQVVPVADDAMQQFYRRLFEIDPGLLPLFAASDMREQRARLAQALSAVVDGLDDIERLLPQIEALGRRHVAYGATAKHYDSVGEALLWTLRRGLGDAWSEAAEAAWSDAYGLVSRVMQKAAADHSAGASPSGPGLAVLDTASASCN